ncbi:Ger(x)C family spore germination protein [Aquibacillus sediminis]|uniref:Ger(x)C family spore germination protein n=1 Tax=Aquibacillus sediminis TaxID=2574734 RepID=UPI0011093E4D|nr:Ger(x)C family spore germination protein [Aquibacillus sediminis]
MFIPKRGSLVPLFCALLLLTGCWDSVEVEERAFIYGATVDLSDQQTEQNQQLILTDQVVVPSGIGTSTTEGGQEQAYRNISITGENINHMNTQLSKKANRTLFAQHLEVLIFSEEVTKQPEVFENSLDVFTRGQEMRRGMKVAVANGKASALLDIKPEHIKLPSQYIETLLENQRSSEVAKPLRLDDLHKYLFLDFSFVIPYLSISDDKNIEHNGVAVFNGNERVVVGRLDGELTKGRNFLTGEAEFGTMMIPVDDSKSDSKSVVQFTEVNSDLQLVNNDKNNLQFEIKMDVAGNITETSSKTNPFENLDTYSKALEKSIKQLTERTIEQAQNELQTDIFKLNVYLRGNHYKLWQSIKDDWDTGENYFSKSDIDVKVNGTVEHSGNTIYSTDKEQN